MPEQFKVSREYFENALTPEAVRITRLTHIVLMAGVFFFTCIIGFLYANSHVKPGSSHDAGLFNLLTMVGLLFTFSAIVVGNFLFRYLFSPNRLPAVLSSTSAEELAARCVVLHRTANLVRMALLECAASFGLVVCLVGVTDGMLAAEPKYWVNLLPVAVFFVFGITTIPSKERIASTFEEHFLGS